MAESLAVHLPDSLSIRNRPGSLGSGEGSELVCYIQQFKPLRKRETQALRGLREDQPSPGRCQQGIGRQGGVRKKEQ